MNIFTKCLNKTKHADLHKLISFIYWYPIINAIAYLLMLVLVKFHIFRVEILIVDGYTLFSVIHEILMLLMSYFSGFCIFHRIATAVPIMGTIAFILSENLKLHSTIGIIVCLSVILAISTIRAIKNLKN